MVSAGSRRSGAFTGSDCEFLRASCSCSRLVRGRITQERASEAVIDGSLRSSRRVWHFFVERVALEFSTGQVVVHPHHGPATVKRTFSRSIRGERRKYLRLQVHHDDLLVAVPVETAEEIGVRPTIDLEEVREIFDVLLAESGKQEKVWSRRIKSNTERLRTGDMKTVAALIRDLTRQNDEKRLAFGEMKLLRDATGPFVAELALVLSKDAEEVTEMMNAAILEDVKPELPDAKL